MGDFAWKLILNCQATGIGIHWAHYENSLDKKVFIRVLVGGSADLGASQLRVKDGDILQVIG